MMDVEKNETVIVLDCGKDLTEVAVEGTCCSGRPSSAATVSSDR
jgi:hypothetical protein